MTQRARYSFVRKEYVSGQPWIALELLDGAPIPPLTRGFIGFDLREGATIEDAKKVEAFLNQHVTNVTYTGDDER